MNKEGTLIKVRHSLRYFDNLDISSVESAESIENEIVRDQDKLKGEFLAFALSTPKDITPKGENPIDYIKEKIDELFDSLYESYENYFTAKEINDIIDEWKYSYPESRELYDNISDNKELNKIIFPQDRHVEIKRDLTKFTFAPPDDKVTDTIVRSIENINLNNEISDFINDKYIIIVNKKIYSEYDGQFVFKSKEDAEKVLKDKINFNAIDYIQKGFIENHPNFFVSLTNLMKENNYPKKDIEQLDKDIHDFISGDNSGEYNMQTLQNIYDTINDVIYKEIYTLADIRIVKLSELIDYFIKK